MSGPVGAFYLKEDRPTLLIAGGIGVTPFRAMLKELENEQRNHPIHLLKALATSFLKSGGATVKCENPQNRL